MELDPFYSCNEGKAEKSKASPFASMQDPLSLYRAPSPMHSELCYEHPAEAFSCSSTGASVTGKHGYQCIFLTFRNIHPIRIEGSVSCSFPKVRSFKPLGGEESVEDAEKLYRPIGAKFSIENRIS